MARDIDHWHARLASHFEVLAAKRHSGSGTPPVFALEHGLDDAEIKDLLRAVRMHIGSCDPSWQHRLPWIVYAAELGYHYSGYEYWQTFEERTPGWAAHRDRYRQWLRKCYRWFQREYGGATPSGQWAEWFTIICWPITHAVLPKDLQYQLARVLYDIRHSFSQEVFASPATLGQLIAERSWTESSRFQNLTQETGLVGQIATALLFKDEPETERLLYPPTLRRISRDLDRKRQQREWLRVARRSAKERARIRGLARESRQSSRRRRTEDVRAEIAALGIEPRLVLQPADTGGASWKVFVEIPDLSNLSKRFPNARDVLAKSRCTVAGFDGRPIARGRFLYGPQWIPLSRWPAPHEVLLQFEQSHSDLEFLLKTECLLRPGPPWLFRIASDGLAYECRGLRVRPGQRYIILTTENLPAFADVVQPANVQCQDIEGTLLNLPVALNSGLEQVIQGFGLAQSRLIEVWPAGLAAAQWDGEGHSEWFAAERPTLGVQSDHPLGMIRVSLDGQPESTLELTRVIPGEPLFLELPSLPVGLHTIRVEATGIEGSRAEDLGYLKVAIRVREARPKHHGVSPSGPLAVRVDPVMPTLEQLWDGQVEVEILGPHERTVKCAISLLDKGKEILAMPLPPLELPVTPSSKWRAHFDKHFRQNKKVQKKYDAAYGCRMIFTAGELGTFTVWCEREFTPLRWVLGERNRNPIVRLINDSGHAEAPQVSHFAFGKPAVEECLAPDQEYKVSAPGGLYLARQGDFSSGIIVRRQSSTRSFGKLVVHPVIQRQQRSLFTVLDLVKLSCKWGIAKSSGDILSVISRRKVLREITQHVIGLIGGERWAKAELDYEDKSDLSILERAVLKQQGQVNLAEFLTHESEIANFNFAAAPIDKRVRRLAILATRRHLPNVREDDSRILRDPNWMAEFALRLASSPRDADEWAQTHLRAAVTYLMEAPVLARAARFIVLSTNSLSGTNAGPDEVYAGWRWP